MQECFVNIGPPLVAHHAPAILRRPGQGALHHLPVPPQLLTTLDSLPGYPELDALLAQRLATPLVIVGGVWLLRSLARASLFTAFDRFGGLRQLLEGRRAGGAGGAERHREQQHVLSTDHNVALQVRSALMRRILAGCLTYFLLGTLAEPNDTLDWLMWSTSPRWPRSDRSNPRRTPVTSHSLRHYQRVALLTQAISPPDYPDFGRSLLLIHSQGR
jgi:hypothetical protein